MDFDKVVEIMKNALISFEKELEKLRRKYLRKRNEELKKGEEKQLEKIRKEITK